MKKRAKRSTVAQFKEIYTNSKNSTDRVLICRIYEKRKRIDYFLHPHAPQYKWIQKIKIDGFEKLPAGFSKNGKGLLPKGAGYLLIKKCYEKFGNFDLVISLNKKERIIRKSGKYKVILNYTTLREIQDILREVNNENYNALLDTADAFLNKYFPQHFREKPSDSKIEYKANQLGRILRKDNILNNLSQRDINAVIDFFPLFIKRFGGAIKGKKKLMSILKSRNAVEIVYFEKIIKKFERKIKSKVQNEHSWQRFFRENFLIFNPTYIKVFEKKNLSLGGKYPDFLPVDIYGHLDIFEIKKPNTKLMEYDNNRNNYYWSKELSKAIAQVENYIYNAVTHSADLILEIKRKENMDVKIIKPRGYIVAGTREQLKTQEIDEYFRLLNESLKNVRVILYDDVLDNLRAFLKKTMA